MVDDNQEKELDYLNKHYHKETNDFMQLIKYKNTEVFFQKDQLLIWVLRNPHLKLI